MEKIDLFSLEQHEGPYEKWPRRTRLYFGGRDTGTKIPGFIIEGQYKCDDGYLLITSQDCPFEESNDFILLGPSFQEIARNELLVPYDSFLLHAHWPISNVAVRLHYNDRLFFTLSIQKGAGLIGNKPTLALNLFNDIENDAEAIASVNDLQQRLRDLTERLGKNKVPAN